MLEELSMLAVSFLVGFAVFAYAVSGRWGTWLWLRTWGDRLAFFLWPRPPWRVVKLTFLDGGQHLVYNPEIEEYRDKAEIRTPWGVVVVPELAKTVLPMTALYLPGSPNPLSLVVYAMTGLIAAWLSFYYGYLLLGLPVGGEFALLAMVFMAYIYLWYQAASTSGVEYHSYEVRGISPPALHAVPSSELVGPLRAAKYWNTPIHVRISRHARKALEVIKDALGVDDVNEAASALSKAEFVQTILQASTDIKINAQQFREALDGMIKLRLAFGRITVGRVLLFALFFFMGLLVGWALGGGSVIVSPVSHNASMGVAP